MGVKSEVELVNTDVLVCLVTQENPKTLKRARRLFAREGETLVLEDVAVAEAVAILAGDRYNFTREQIASVLVAAMEIPNLVCNGAVIREALEHFVENPELSFADCYLWARAESAEEAALWTFDRKMTAQCPVAMGV